MKPCCLILTSILFLIFYVESQETINCGESKEGTRSSGQEIEYRFISSGRYERVYLDSCGSNYDILLKLQNSVGQQIAEQDDGNLHGPECDNSLATDITIPDLYLPVLNGDMYTFIISGYRWNNNGQYLVTLVCIESISATIWPPIQCGDIIRGHRGENERIQYLFTSPASFDLVYLEGCHTTFDLILTIQDINGNQIALEDDTNTHGPQCDNRFSTDITIPAADGTPGIVSNGDQYIFTISGYNGHNTGEYTVQLFCTQSNVNPPTDHPTPAPTNNAIRDDSSMICGETKTGRRERGQEIEYAFISTADYDEVELNGCNSDYDLLLKLTNSADIEILEEDDNRALCGDHNGFATNLIIPGGVRRDDSYTFIISGFRSNSIGSYSVTLTCTASSGVLPTPPPSAAPPVPTPSECARHREAWHLINDAQRQLYIDGFKELYRNGRLAVFVRAHGDPTSSNQGHGNAAFLPWHRYFIYEFETQIRNLGHEYQCFSLPYWDWTSDIERYEYNIGNYFILNSGLGGNGTGSGGCVEGTFGRNQYVPVNGNCLRREVCGSDCDWGDASASELMSTLTTSSRYGGDGDGGYRDLLEGAPHGWAHVAIGGDGQLGSIATAVDDPVFMLLHSMIDMQYSLWQDCRDHELIDNQDITTTMYGGTQALLDTPIILKDLQRVSWSHISQNRVTVRDMHDNTDWGVSYDRGDFFNRARVDNNRICSGKINPNWFKDETRRRHRARLMDSASSASSMEMVDFAKDRGKKKKRTKTFSDVKQDIFDRLDDKLGGDDKSILQNEELYKTWAEINCQYLSIQNKCSRPKYFDDCRDMERSIDIGFNGFNDIDITLDELIEKVEDYPCMIETREKLFNWAKESGNLYGLCGGQYDRFCDKDFAKEKGEDKCLRKKDKKKRKRKDKDKDKDNLSSSKEKSTEKREEKHKFYAWYK